MDDLTRFCCLEPDCVHPGLRGQGNIAARARYGKARRRLPYRKTCKRRFSERKGTPLFHCHLPDEVAHSLFAHVREGCGARATGRLVGVALNTVPGLGRKAGEHAKDAHDELVGFSPLHDPAATGREVEALVGKKEKNCSPLDKADACLGEQWDFVALDPASRLILGVVVGKRVG